MLCVRVWVTAWLLPALELLLAGLCVRSFSFNCLHSECSTRLLVAWCERGVSLLCALTCVQWRCGSKNSTVKNPRQSKYKSSNGWRQDYHQLAVSAKLLESGQLTCSDCVSGPDSCRASTVPECRADTLLAPSLPSSQPRLCIHSLQPASVLNPLNSIRSARLSPPRPLSMNCM